MANPYKPIVTSFSRKSFEDIFIEVRRMRPDLTSNSEIAQEAMRVFARHLKAGNDPLATMQSPVQKSQGKARTGAKAGFRMPPETNTASAGTKKMSQAWLDHGTSDSSSTAFQMALIGGPVYTASGGFLEWEVW